MELKVDDRRNFWNYRWNFLELFGTERTFGTNVGTEGTFGNNVGTEGTL